MEEHKEDNLDISHPLCETLFHATFFFFNFIALQSISWNNFSNTSPRTFEGNPRPEVIIFVS